MNRAGLTWGAVLLLGAAAPAAPPIGLTLGASGAVSDKVSLTGTADDAHLCALIGPSGGPQTYLFLFNKSPADAMLNPQRPGLFLTVAGAHAAAGKPDDASHGTIQVAIGGRLFLGLGPEDASFRLHITLQPDGTGGSFTAKHLVDLSGNAAVDVEGSWRCPLGTALAPGAATAPRSAAALPGSAAHPAPPPPHSPATAALPAAPAAAGSPAAAPAMPSAAPPDRGAPGQSAEASPLAAGRTAPRAAISALAVPSASGVPTQAMPEPSKAPGPDRQQSELAASLVPLDVPAAKLSKAAPEPARPSAGTARPGHFRLFRGSAHCRRACGGWVAVDLDNGRRFSAGADFTAVGLAPGLAAEARAGRIEILVTGEIARAANGDPVGIRVQRLDGVEPHAAGRGRRKHSG